MTRTARLRLATVAASAGLAASAPLALATGASATPAPTASTVAHAGGDHAVFALTNDPSANGVVAFTRADDGTLTRGATYPTGGLGARLVGAAVDPLASQGALAYDASHGLLLAVNGGSDSLTVFAVHGSRLTRLQVLASGGAVPVSVAVSGDVAYVLDAGGDGAVRGFRLTPRGLVPIPGSTRGLGLGGAALPGFLTAPAQIGITPDRRHVVVTTKTHGTVVVWSLDPAGRPSTEPTVTDVAGVPFAFSFDAAGRLLLVNAVGTLSTWMVEDDGALVPVFPPVGDLGRAACWIATSGGYAYVANAGSGTLSGYAIGADGSLRLLDADGVTATTGPGPIDVASADGFVYVENGGDGSISGYAVASDGSLLPVETVTGLTADGGTGVEGLVAL